MVFECAFDWFELAGSRQFDKEWLTPSDDFGNPIGQSLLSPFLHPCSVSGACLEESKSVSREQRRMRRSSPSQADRSAE